MFGSIHLCLKQQIVPSCLIAATVTEVHTAHSSSESSWVAANRTSHLICARPRRGGECYSRASSDVEVTSSRHVGTLTLATTHELSRGLLIPSRRCAQSSQGAFVCRNRLLIRPDSGKEKFQGYFLRPKGGRCRRTARGGAGHVGRMCAEGAARAAGRGHRPARLGTGTSNGGLRARRE